MTEFLLLFTAVACYTGSVFSFLWAAETDDHQHEQRRTVGGNPSSNRPAADLFGPLPRGKQRKTTDFYEDDEPIADVIKAFNEGLPGVTHGPDTPPPAA